MENMWLARGQAGVGISTKQQHLGGGLNSSKLMMEITII